MKKVKIVILIFAVFITLAFTSCDISSFIPDTDTDGYTDEFDDKLNNGDQNPHECEFVLISSTAPSCTENGIKQYSCEVCGQKKNVNIAPAHTLVVEAERAASCETAGRTAHTYCKICGVVIAQGEEIPKLSHTEVIDPATEATATSPAKTEGKHCSVCGYVIVKQQFVFSDDYSNPNSYDGTYAYESLLKLNKAEKLTELYNLIDEKADYFHSSGIDAGDGGIVASIDYSALGLTSEEAIAVWSAYRTDHPLYYWISTKVTYTSKVIELKAYDEYIDADVRSVYNSKIYTGVKVFVEKALSDTAYNTALAFHDLIILACDYSYEEDGVTPSDDVWAHNILGVFDTGYGVCESYAKSFQLLLNFCRIDNILVFGYAGEAHAWNLVKLDDGEWYWCDLTWDDTPEFMWGISHRYFCVNDTENVGWIDGPWTVESSTFISSHTPYQKDDTGSDFAYELPARSETVFDSAKIMLRDTFKVGDLTYAVADYKSVQLVSIDTIGSVVIPPSVVYEGVTFDVISIGRIENGLFKTGCIAVEYDGTYKTPLEVTEVYIPESVIFIWDDAFDMNSLEAINVDEDNPSFASLDGVLFNKDFTTLVKYPTGKTATNYTVPDSVIRIAAGAFENFYIKLKLTLTSITLGSGVESCGIANRGYGYDEITDSNFVSDEWSNIRNYLSGSAKIFNPDGTEFDENAA